jgi:DtxR family manganese transport transcriptional regulator
MDKTSQEYSQRAAHFKETRNNRLYEIAEDYTELVADLIQTQGHARVCDIAREMGISHVSVLKTLKKLIRDGYLEKNSHGTIYLTPKGSEMAFHSKKKHQVLSQFLIWLGVPEQIAATDVEGIEHHISSTTLEAIEAHMRAER